MKENTYRLFWLDGKTEDIKGFSISDAFMKAGYGGGTLAALDYWKESQDKITSIEEGDLI